MPLYKSNNQKITRLKKEDFRSEKELQLFVEKNLDELFGIRFIESEYATTPNHGGRIDTLGIDENNAPVIIEYKWGENSTIINQGLFYLDWLMDHPGDFQILVQQKLGVNVAVDHGSPRLILIAASFTKYDKFAINRMAENIELWSYSRYEEGIFELRAVASSQASVDRSNSKQVTKGVYETYSVERLLQGKTPLVKELMDELRERIMSLDTDGSIEENPKKHYVSYRTNRNFVYINFRKSSLYIDVPLISEDITSINPDQYRDMRDVGHHGAGYSRFDLNSFDQLDTAMKLIRESYEKYS